MIRVLVCDDQALVRAGLRMILEAHADLVVVGEAGDGVQGVETSEQLMPDVVLMDIRMPRMDGIEATRQLLAAQNAPKVLILTTFDEDEYVYAALKEGASGFMLKSAPPADLVRAIHLVHEGQALLSPEITRRLIEDYVRHPSAGEMAELTELTAREVEVLGLIAKGLSNREIAEALVVSQTTVKSHINRIFSKLNLRDRVHAVILAYERGLVVPGD